jgi:UDP-N-acetylglucosamine:LPS N-acetylglucosamine transferase
LAVDKQTRHVHPKGVVLTVLAGGGFTFETACLLKSFDEGTAFVYLAQPYGGQPGRDGIPLGECLPVPQFASVTHTSKAQSMKAFIATFVKAVKVMRLTSVAVVMGVGCSYLVPMFLAARVFGRKTIFIESITRADRLSMTGRIIYAGRLADTFIVQWPELAARLPRSELGSIL